MILPETLGDKIKGFTLIELLVVIAILLIIVSISIPLYGNIQQSTQLNDVSSNIIQTIRIAQNRASSGFNNSNHGVYFDVSNDRFVLYQGDSYLTRSSAYDRVFEYGEVLDITTTLTGNEINFSKGVGEPDNVGDINIDHQTGGQKEININDNGYVQEN
jgi:type IV fimbrial biogenesis protein FimU